MEEVSMKGWMWTLFLLISFTSGCTAVAVTGAGVGINYTITNVAYKTFNYPIKDVEKATKKALKRMDIKFIAESDTEKGKKIKAATAELDIVIDLESITSKTTKIKVDAKKGPILKDKATAAEIIHQVEKDLEG